MKKSGGESVYSRIAFDIAVKIACGELKKGAKITGRSLMGTRYRTSPETIRRALWHLNEVGIIATQGNVGSTVLSQERAAEYVERHQLGSDLLALEARLDGMIAAREKLDRDIAATLKQILDLSERFRSSDRLRMFTFTVGDGSAVLGLSIRDLQFRQKTGATIVAIRRGGEIMLSPEPSTEFKIDDALIVACGIQQAGRVAELLGPRFQR